MLNDTQKHPACWAKDRGGCSRKISREHIISKALPETETILVMGLPWCLHDYRAVGINSLTTKCLCRTHNHALSVVDKAGVSAVRMLRRLLARNDSAMLRPVERSVGVDGLMLERWLLKTAINTVIGSDLYIGPMSEQQGLPPPYLVAAAFGDLPLSHKMGLYAIVQEGSNVPSTSEIVMVPIVRDRIVGGWYFGIYGVDFFLSLFPLGDGIGPPKNLRSIGVTDLPDHVIEGQLHYRVSAISVRGGQSEPRSLHLSWTAV